MPLRPAHALAALLLEHANLGTARFAFDHADDLGIRDKWRSGNDFAAVFFHQEHLTERQLRAGLSGRAVEDDHGARRRLDLSSAGLNDCVHVWHLCKGDSLLPSAEVGPALTSWRARWRPAAALRRRPPGCAVPAHI